MPYCAVAKCYSSNRQSSSKQNFSFFVFPNDSKRRAEWIHRCGRADPINPRTARICSKHFQDEDFYPTTIMKRSFGIKCKLLLKQDAIPSVYLPTGQRWVMLEGIVSLEWNVCIITLQWQRYRYHCNNQSNFRCHPTCILCTLLLKFKLSFMV